MEAKNLDIRTNLNKIAVIKHKMKNNNLDFKYQNYRKAYDLIPKKEE